MNKKIAAIALGFFTMLFSQAALADGRATRDDAVALVRDAKQFLKTNGRVLAFAEFNKPAGRFTHGELYVVALGFDGIVQAHGGNPRLIGKNILGIKDANGKLFVQDHIRVAKSPGSGWVEFSWPNPVSKKIEPKAVWVEAAGELILAAGVYTAE